MTDRRRLWRAENQEISISENLFGSTFRVEGTRGKMYIVDLEKPSCECPDWQKRSPTGGCKHILKVKLKIGDVEPLPSEKTDANSPRSRSQSNYSKGWKSLSEKTKKRDNWECQRCSNVGGPEGDSTLHAHHIVPKSEGGEDRIENLITVCHECHEQIHGHPIPSPESTSPVASRADGESTTEKSHSSTQPAAEKTSMEDYLPENSQSDSETPDGYPHSKSNHEVSKAESAIQEDQSNEPLVENENQSGRNDDKGNDLHDDSSTGWNNSQEQSQNDKLENDGSIGIVGTVWGCIGLTLVLTAVLPPAITFAPWKLGVSAGLCSLLFLVQLISKSSDEYLRDLTGSIIFTYVSLTAVLASIV